MPGILKFYLPISLRNGLIAVCTQQCNRTSSVFPAISGKALPHLLIFAKSLHIQARYTLQNRVCTQIHSHYGTAFEFQKMQEEYKSLLIRLQQNHNAVGRKNPSPETELLSELGKLATVLIEKQVPQEYLKQRITKSQSPVEQRIYSGLISFLDGLSK